jgi:hypothetical protein
MKHTIQRFVCLKLALVFVLSLCLYASFALSQRQAAQAQFSPQRGTDCCDLLSGRGQGVAGGPDLFVVDAEFNLSGAQFGGAFGARALQIKSSTRLLAQNPPATDGTVNAITSHVFEVKGQSDEDGVCEPGEDCLVTLDRATLTPTTTPGLMKLKSTLAFSTGQGRFAKACGKVDATDGDGEINFAATPPTVRWSFSGGRLCECP